LPQSYASALHIGCIGRDLRLRVGEEAVARRLAQSLRYEPYRLVGDAQDAVQLVRGDALLLAAIGCAASSHLCSGTWLRSNMVPTATEKSLRHSFAAQRYLPGLPFSSYAPPIVPQCGLTVPGRPSDSGRRVVVAVDPPAPEPLCQAHDEIPADERDLEPEDDAANDDHGRAGRTDISGDCRRDGPAVQWDRGSYTDDWRHVQRCQSSCRPDGGAGGTLSGERAS